MTSSVTDVDSDAVSSWLCDAVVVLWLLVVATTVDSAGVATADVGDDVVLST